MSRKFQLTLPRVITSINVQQAAALTAFAMYKGDNSVDSVLNILKDVGAEEFQAAIDWAFDGTSKTRKPIPINWRGEKLDRSEVFWEILFEQPNVESTFALTFYEHERTLKKKFANGEIELRDPLSNIVLGPNESSHIRSGLVSFHDFKKFALELGICVTVDGELNTVNLESAVKPVQRAKAQDEAIKAKIQQLGHTLLALPKNISTKAGVKAAVRAAVVRENPSMWQGKVFDKAWQRLRDNNEIGESATL
jgi:hypothetical protein